MRRALASLLAVAALAAGAGTAAPAVADGYYGHGRYERDGYYDRRCDCYRGRERGYWERPSDRRRGWNRYHHRRYRDSGVHYYPGYGYYPDRGHHGRYDRHRGRDRGRSAWCARNYRSYDWRTGTFVGYDGVRRYCG